MSRLEELISALLNGEQVDIVPQSRIEAYLKNCCDKCGCDGLPTPEARVEILLYQLAEQLAGGGGGDTPGGGSSGENKLAKVAEGTVTEITAEDLQGCTKIADYAFYSCESLRNIAIPDSATSIGKSAFASCSKLTSVIIGNGVTSIGERAFDNCTYLVSINIPNGITSIGKYAFQNCRQLTNIYIPNGVKTIEQSTFASCTSMQYIDFTACTSVPTLANSNAFSSVPTTCEIRVPPHLVAEWRAATNWSKYASQIVGYIEPSETERKVFTLANFGHTSTLTNNNTFFFEEGMTWGEWKSTAYNTLIANGNDEKFGTHTNVEEITIDVSVLIDTPVEGITYADGTPVKDSEVIDESTAYEFRDLDYYIPQ